MPKKKLRGPGSKWTDELDELYCDIAARGYSVHQAWKMDITDPFREAGIKEGTFKAHQYRGGKELRLAYQLAKHTGFTRESLDTLNELRTQDENKKIQFESARELHRISSRITGLIGDEVDSRIYKTDSDEDSELEVITPTRINLGRKGPTTITIKQE